MQTIINKAKTISEIQACYPIMRELRPHLTNIEGFLDQVKRQLAAGYQLAYIHEEDKIRAVAGFRFLEFLAWGKVLYIDDLVTDSEKRNQGHGGQLLKWVIERAKEEQCDQVHLDSGPHRHEAHKLYLNHGFKIIGHHFALTLKA